jgi:hypothetical protein
VSSYFPPLPDGVDEVLDKRRHIHEAIRRFHILVMTVIAFTSLIVEANYA